METKFFLQSKTIIGAILIVISTLAPLIGFTFTTADVALVGGNVGNIIDGIGVLLVVWGRISAKTELVATPPA